MSPSRPQYTSNISGADKAFPILSCSATGQMPTKTKSTLCMEMTKPTKQLHKSDGSFQSEPVLF